MRAHGRSRGEASSLASDREVHIVYMLLMPGEDVAHSEETDWGMIDRSRSGQPVAIEIWEPTNLFPVDFMAVMPPPIWTGRRNEWLRFRNRKGEA